MVSSTSGCVPSEAWSGGSSTQRIAKRGTYRDFLDTNTLSLGRTADCFRLIEENNRLSYDLPRKGALAGHVLKHCFRVLDDHLARKSPMTFKIGYTHDAHCRWHNRKYGYSHDYRNKWEGMNVVYASSETISASFVEAAMIQRYMGSLPALVQQ